MTGTAIYQLKQQKQLTWDISLHRYFLQVDGSDDITIRELMNHTSGLINNDRPPFPLKEENSKLLTC